MIIFFALSMLGAPLAHGLDHAMLPASGPYQQVVICASCTESGDLVDARSKPVDTDAPGTELLCPDCLTVTSAALPVNDALRCRTSPPRAAGAPLADILLPICRPAHEATRGPPHKV